FGVEVTGDSGYIATAICSTGLSVTVSIDQTDALFAHATRSRRPSFDSAIAFGCSSTAISVMIVSESALRTSTREPPQSDTYTSFPSDDGSAVYGSVASCVVFVTCPLARSIAEIVIANTRVTNSVFPSRLTASPPANVSPAIPG